MRGQARRRGGRLLRRGGLRLPFAPLAQEPYEPSRRGRPAGLRLRRRRFVLLRLLEEVRDLDAAREPLDLRPRPRPAARGQGPPVGVDAVAWAEFVETGEVRRHVLPLLRLRRRRRLTPPPAAPGAALYGYRRRRRRRRRRRAGQFAQGVEDFLRRADPLQDAPYGRRGVRVVLGAPTVDLVPQPRHQPHPVPRRQLPPLRQVPDPAQIFVDQMVALDPHAPAPHVPPDRKVARASVEQPSAQRIPWTGWGPADDRPT